MAGKESGEVCFKVIYIWNTVYCADNVAVSNKSRNEHNWPFKAQYGQFLNVPNLQAVT
jgi:hypothetical protein